MSHDSGTLPPPPPPPPPSAPAGTPGAPYPARLEVHYPDKLNRVTTAFRLVLVIPIAILFGILAGGGSQTVQTQSGEWVTTTTAGISGSLFIVTLLMILFRRRYPRWWFDFALELTRFSARVCAYFVLLTDAYPSTVEQQAVRLDVEYPEVERDLKRGMPLVKWFLAIPHYFVLLFLFIGAFFVVIVAWFAILFTGRYPRGMFDYVVGVGRWALRVDAYAFLLTTDRYPPFSLR
ncbi:MAG: DUF4389 domain-containing protein [Ilumatobacteraceae bacterium]